MNLLRYLPRFRRAYRELEALAAREACSRADIEALQLERLNALWAHAAVHVPYYRRLAAQANLPPRFISLEEFRQAMPVLPKAAVKNRPRDFLSERPGRGEWHCSSGSTGVPTAYYWEYDAHQELLRCRYRMHAAWGLDLFDRAVFLWGRFGHLQPGLAGFAARLRQPLEDWLRNRLRLDIYRLGRDDVRGHLRRLAAFRPALLYAYSTPAYLLAQEAQAIGLRCDSLRVAVLSAEPAFPHFKAAVERAFGVPAVVEYGATECPFIAGEGLDRTLRVREDVVLLETQPAVSGRHEILVTPLNNPSFPLLRYAIGDETDAPLTVPARGFAVLENVAGRDNDLLRSRTGRWLHATRFDALFDVKHPAAVRRYRVHQRADGAIMIAVELADPAVRLDPRPIEREACALVEGYPVTVQIVPTLPAAAAGKHRWITSDIAPDRAGVDGAIANATYCPTIPGEKGS